MVFFCTDSECSVRKMVEKSVRKLTRHNLLGFRFDSPSWFFSSLYTFYSRQFACGETTCARFNDHAAKILYSAIQALCYANQISSLFQMLFPFLLSSSSSVPSIPGTIVANYHESRKTYTFFLIRTQFIRT